MKVTVLTKLVDLESEFVKVQVLYEEKTVALCYKPMINKLDISK